MGKQCMYHNGPPTFKEEVANAITHGIGVLLSIIGLTLLVSYTLIGGDPWRIVSVTVFGLTLIFMYLASTLYHALPHPPVKRALRILDHCAIYCLIAGTYTPFLLVSMRGPWGWTLFGLLWGIAVAGCFFKIAFIDKHQNRWWDRISVLLYVAMGWLIVIALKPALEMVPGQAMLLLLIGGASYTAGIIFYLWDRLPYNHAIWHLFVLGGSATHFCAIFYFIVPIPH